MKKFVRIRTAHAVKFISSGCDVLDCALGGGWARGRVANIVGDRSSGKTLLAIEGAIKALREHKFTKDDSKRRVRVVYDAAEGSMDFDLEKMYKIKGVRQLIEWVYSDTVEDFDANVAEVCSTVSENDLLIYILDSLDSLTDEKERAFDKKRQKRVQQKASGDEYNDGKKEKGSYGTDKARLMNRFFRRNCLSMAKNDVLLIIISQTRQNIGVRFGPTKKRSCADALDFYEAQEVWLSETGKASKKVTTKAGARERVTGIRVRARIKKLKVGVPFREGDFSIVFDYGIDNIGSNVDFLYNLIDGWGKLKKAESNQRALEWDGKLYTRKSLIQHIESNSLEKELTKRVKEEWKNIENAVVEDRKQKYE